MRHRKRGGSTCMRNGRMSGGNLGQGFRLGAEMLTRGYAVNEAYNTCGAMSRPGQLSTDAISTMGKGIPGLAGGGKRRHSRKAFRKSRRGNRKQKGGRYEAVFEGAEYEALGPRGGMLATAGNLPCERGAGAYVSPTPSTLPARQAGGATQLAPAPFLQEQTAGYTMRPSTWLDSVGAPLELRTPVGGQMPVPACKTTGGGRKKMRGGVTVTDQTAYVGRLQDALRNLGEEIASMENSDPNKQSLIEQELKLKETLATEQATLDTLVAAAQPPAAENSQTTPVAPVGSLPPAATEPNSTRLNNTGQLPTQGGRRGNRKASRKARKSSRKSSRKARKSSRKAYRKH